MTACDVVRRLNGKGVKEPVLYVGLAVHVLNDFVWRPKPKRIKIEARTIIKEERGPVGARIITVIDVDYNAPA